ncbi:MAG TPA: alpha/beta fold hydrolase [Geobacteraceae bacterium]
MQTIINGINLAYDDHGTGLPVVLIHGFPLCRKMWHPQVQKLTEAGYRLILPDLRGFGESDAPDGPYSVEQFADDVIALLDHLCIEKAVVGGMSMGGYVLFDLCERYPGRLAGACFITTRAVADDEAGKARRLQLAQEVMKFGPQVVAAAFEKLLFAEASLTERPKLVAEVCRWMTANDSRGLAGGLLAMRERKDYTALLPTFTLPALAIGAAGDKAAPPELSRAIATAIPGCRHCIVPDAGHLANLEHPGAFNRCLLDFLEEVAGKGNAC